MSGAGDKGVHRSAEETNQHGSVWMKDDNPTVKRILVEGVQPRKAAASPGL